MIGSPFKLYGTNLNDRGSDKDKDKKPKRVIQSIDFGTKNANPISSSKKTDSSYKKDNSSYKKQIRRNNKHNRVDNQKKKLEYDCEGEDGSKTPSQDIICNLIPKSNI